MYGALKRKRGPGHSILEAAQSGGDVARSAYVKSLKNTNPSVGKRIAQSSLSIPKGRSGIRHLMKQPNSKAMYPDRNRMHHHDVMRKYYRGKPKNGIKAHIRTYASS